MYLSMLCPFNVNIFSIGRENEKHSIVIDAVCTEQASVVGMFYEKKYTCINTYL